MIAVRRIIGQFLGVAIFLAAVPALLCSEPGGADPGASELVRAGVAAFERGEYAAAEGALTRFLSEFGSSEEVRAARGRLLTIVALSRVGAARWREARETIAECLALGPAGGVERMEDLRYWDAACACEAGDWDGTRAAAERFLAAHPRSWRAQQARLLTARAWLGSGDRERAAGELDRLRRECSWPECGRAAGLLLEIWIAAGDRPRALVLAREEYARPDEIPDPATFALRVRALADACIAAGDCRAAIGCLHRVWSRRAILDALAHQAERWRADVARAERGKDAARAAAARAALGEVEASALKLRADDRFDAATALARARAFRESKRHREAAWILERTLDAPGADPGTEEARVRGSRRSRERGAHLSRVPRTGRSRRSTGIGRGARPRPRAGGGRGMKATEILPSAGALLAWFLAFGPGRCPGADPAALDTLVRVGGGEQRGRVLGCDQGRLRFEVRIDGHAASAVISVPRSEVARVRFGPSAGAGGGAGSEVARGLEDLRASWSVERQYLDLPESGAGDIGIALGERLASEDPAGALAVLDEVATRDWQIERRARAARARVLVMIRAGRAREVMREAEAMAVRDGDVVPSLEAHLALGEEAAERLRVLAREHPRWEREPAMARERERLWRGAIADLLHPFLFAGAHDAEAARGLSRAAALEEAMGAPEHAREYWTDLVELYPDQPQAGDARERLARSEGRLSSARQEVDR